VAAIRGHPQGVQKDSALQPPFTPNPVVYRILGEEQAALPTTGRYPNSRIQRILQQVEDRGLEPLTFWLPVRLRPHFPRWPYIDTY